MIAHPFHSLTSIRSKESSYFCLVFLDSWTWILNYVFYTCISSKSIKLNVDQLIFKLSVEKNIFLINLITFFTDFENRQTDKQRRTDRVRDRVRDREREREWEKVLKKYSTVFGQGVFSKKISYWAFPCVPSKFDCFTSKYSTVSLKDLWVK